MQLALKSNKRIIWDHFTDTIWLIGLDLVLLCILNWIGPLVPGSSDFVPLVQLFSKWFLISALVQFGIESLLDLAAKDAHLVREIFRLKGGSS
jgi:hypothetical protein